MDHLQNKSQHVVYTGLSMISCLAMSPDFSTLAVGHGHPNTKDSAQIILFSVAEGRFSETHRLSFHDTGVSMLRFSNDGNKLISVGAHGEKAIAVWTVHDG